MSEITLNALPKTLDELKAMPQAVLTVPEEVAALTVAALALYPESPAETEKMLDFLRGPRPLNGIDKQFIRDRFRGKDYLMRSYFLGSCPENNYTPAQPYRVSQPRGFMPKGPPPAGCGCRSGAAAPTGTTARWTAYAPKA